jgi:hypothetical protein
MKNALNGMHMKVIISPTARPAPPPDASSTLTACIGGGSSGVSGVAGVSVTEEAGCSSSAFNVIPKTPKSTPRETSSPFTKPSKADWPGPDEISAESAEVDCINSTRKWDTSCKRLETPAKGATSPLLSMVTLTLSSGNFSQTPTAARTAPRSPEASSRALEYWKVRRKLALPRGSVQLGTSQGPVT